MSTYFYYIDNRSTQLLPKLSKVKNVLMCTFCLWVNDIHIWIKQNATPYIFSDDGCYYRVPVLLIHLRTDSQTKVFQYETPLLNLQTKFQKYPLHNSVTKKWIHCNPTIPPSVSIKIFYSLSFKSLLPSAHKRQYFSKRITLEWGSSTSKEVFKNVMSLYDMAW